MPLLPEIQPYDKIPQLGTNALSQYALDGSGQRQTDISWEMVMLFSDSQKNPAMLENIKNSGQIPEGRKDDCDLFSDPGQFLEKSDGIFNVLEGVRAENGLELMILERQAVNRIDQDEVWQFLVMDDVRVDAAAVRLAATDIEIPSPFSKDAFLENTIAQEIQGLGENG